MTRPGDGLRRIAGRVCDERTMERLVEPIVADLQAEYGAAVGRRWHSRWLVWRGYAAFWKALALHFLMSTVRPSRSESDVSMFRVMAFSLGALTIMTALLIVPPMLDFKWDGGTMERLRLILLLVPQALPLSIPAGICVGVVCAMRGRPSSARHLMAVLAIAVAATVAVWTMLEWGIPAANQAFREIIAARLSGGRIVSLEPGLNELGLSRLAQRTDARAIEHTRLLWALCFATGPLALFSLGLAGIVRRLGVAVVISLTAIAIYWAFMASLDAALREGALRGGGAWVGNILFILAGVLTLRHGRKSFPRGGVTT